MEDAAAINLQHTSVVDRPQSIEQWMKVSIDRIELSIEKFGRQLNTNIKNAAPMPQSDVKDFIRDEAEEV